jgi:hypothetical protein
MRVGYGQGRFLRLFPFAFCSLLLFLAGCGGGGGGGGGGAEKPGTGLPVTITGTVQYEDRKYDEGGFIPPDQVDPDFRYKPVRNAVIEVVRDSDEEVLEPGITGPGGEFNITFTNKGPAGVYVRVKAQTIADTVIVRDTGSLAIYALVSPTLDDAEAGSFDLDLTAGVSSGGGIFNILDVFSEAAEFIGGLAGTVAPPVTALWAAGSCDGTYFEPFTQTIRILGGCDGDTDEYDDTVLLHEYGHFVAQHYSQDHSPGGVHYLGDNDQDLRLAWSEGWGNFFAGAVRGDPLYVDTKGNVANIAFELEGPASPMVPDLPSLAVYTASELSVAAVLWDILDPTTTPPETLINTGGTDTLSAGMAPIWDVITGYLCPLCSLETVSFEDFWDGWFAQGHGLQSEMEKIVGDRLMALRLDNYEPDDPNPSSGSPVAVDGGPNPPRTLYPAGDVDYFLFDVSNTVPHQVETLSLTNGADTFLEVLGPDGVTVLKDNDDATAVSKSGSCGVNLFTQLSNCPPNDPTTLASSVTFTPSALGTYYIRVKRSPSAPPSAGMYGGYQIQVTTP